MKTIFKIQIGDEMRLEITASGVEAEFCVTIDDVTL